MLGSCGVTGLPDRNWNIPGPGLAGAPNDGIAPPAGAPNDGVAAGGAAPNVGTPVDAAVAPKAGGLLVTTEPKAGGGFEEGAVDPKEGTGVVPNKGAPAALAPELAHPKAKPEDPVVVLPTLAAVAPNWKGETPEAAVPMLWLV